MTYRAMFTDQEWQTLQFMPLWAFTAVAAADGKIDDNETKALIKSLSEGVLLKGALPREVFTSIAAEISTTRSTANLRALVNAPSFAEADFRVQQFAVWTLTDNPTRTGYVGIGSLGVGSGPDADELAEIKALFKEAGIDPSKYRALR